VDDLHLGNDYRRLLAVKVRRVTAMNPKWAVQAQSPAALLPHHEVGSVLILLVGAVILPVCTAGLRSRISGSE